MADTAAMLQAGRLPTERALLAQASPQVSSHNFEETAQFSDDDSSDNGLPESETAAGEPAVTASRSRSWRSRKVAGVPADGLAVVCVGLAAGGALVHLIRCSTTHFHKIFIRDLAM